ncbi:Mth938-like domain-containing protein [Lysobacter sp. A3-1-A15]|uniref:Mth938-like domain-containing protein n=1 Tax=Novilysobacter viscosus TaxID=3098602 RepID=UPI002ED8BDE6
MQLHLEPAGHAYVLRGADGRSALVNDRRLTSSFVIAPGTLLADWPVASPAALEPADLLPLLELQPEVVVLGTGGRQVFPPAAVLAVCLRRGVGVEVMANDAAARTYTVLAGEGRRVVAGFMLDPGT